MRNVHISHSATLPLLPCLQAAVRFLGRPQLLTRASSPPDRRGRVHRWFLYIHSHRSFHTGGTPMQWQRYSRGFMLMMLIGLLVGQPLAWGQQPKSGGTLTVGLAADIAHFDVFHAIGYESYWALENIHSGLVRVDPQ